MRHSAAAASRLRTPRPESYDGSRVGGSPNRWRPVPTPVGRPTGAPWLASRTMDRRPRPIVWLREHPAQADLMLAIVLTIASVSFHLIGVESLSPSEERDPTWWSTVLAVAGVFPIAWRRSHPIQVALVVTVSQVVFTALDFVGTGFIGVLIAIYSVGAHSIGVWRGRALAAIASMISGATLAAAAASEAELREEVEERLARSYRAAAGSTLPAARSAWWWGRLRRCRGPRRIPATRHCPCGGRNCRLRRDSRPERSVRHGGVKIPHSRSR